MSVIENTGQATPTDPNICYSSPDPTASQLVSEISTAAAISRQETPSFKPGWIYGLPLE
jgi:hypothetical protein